MVLVAGVRQGTRPSRCAPVVGALANAVVVAGHGVDFGREVGDGEPSGAADSDLTRPIGPGIRPQGAAADRVWLLLEMRAGGSRRPRPRRRSGGCAGRPRPLNPGPGVGVTTTEPTDEESLPSPASPAAQDRASRPAVPRSTTHDRVERRSGMRKATALSRGPQGRFTCFCRVSPATGHGTALR